MAPNRRTLCILAASALLAAASSTTGADAHPAPHHRGAHTHPLVTGLPGGGFGSTIGPDGDLFVTEPAQGAVVRIDRHTGAVRTFVTGLPKQNPKIGVGGVTDVIFRNGVGYALVTLVSKDVGGSHVDGVYRIDGRHRSTVVADIGAFAMAHPPHADIFIPTGVQYAIENYRRGFLVSDGHHNRIYHVRFDGKVRVFRAFGDIVPTGMETQHGLVYLSEAGPVPHHPHTGKIVSFHDAGEVDTVATGAPLLTDVERGRGRLFAVSQGDFPADGQPGMPATPDTGSLVRAQGGRFVTVAHPVDRPTALEIVGTTAYIVTLGGDVIEVDHVNR